MKNVCKTQVRDSIRDIAQILSKGFVLTQRTDGKSLRTVEYYEGNLRRFLWYAL